MNSLNIVSGLTTTPPETPPRSRQGSAAFQENGSDGAVDFGAVSEKLGEDDVRQEHDAKEEEGDEKTPLIATAGTTGFRDAPGSRVWSIPQRVSHAVLRGVQVVFRTMTAPGRYVIACFYDDQGHFSAILPLRNFKTLLSRRRRKSTAHAVGLGAAPDSDEKSPSTRRSGSRRSQSADSNAASSTAASSDDEVGYEKSSEDSPARHTRSRTSAAAPSSDETAVQKGKIKIKGPSDEALRKRRAAKAAHQRKAAQTQPSNPEDIANYLKSPTSSAVSTPAFKGTRYPRAPAPPRPLVPRRQPSYTLSYSSEAPKKTLIIDLDETLIHSMAKGGRMSTGHMVEVRLNTNPIASSSPPVAGAFGPGVPILYYVHERPGCHEFLRKVSKWYNLVVFTASVQEYADPVIDWLERERRYFGAGNGGGNVATGRYYRQHCTLRNGAYIKDLAQVEPDLSRVMILDNSPMSYIFHEGEFSARHRPFSASQDTGADMLLTDNAIPIEGWISDPTDNDLLHLIPLLEGLQYVTDVRALLALRQGQAQQA